MNNKDIFDGSGDIWPVLIFCFSSEKVWFDT